MWDSAPKSNDENSKAQTEANEKETEYKVHNEALSGHSQQVIQQAQSEQLDRNSKLDSKVK